MMMFDPQQQAEQLAAIGPVTVTLTPGEVFAIVGLMEIANRVTGDAIGCLDTARRALEKLGSTLPAEQRALTKAAGEHARKDLQKQVRERLLAAALAAGACPN